MTLHDLSDDKKHILHNFYLSSRDLLRSGLVPKWSVQKSFEEAIQGFMGDDAWKPTHISETAAKDILSGNGRNVQRAHGLIGRLSRHERTMTILQGIERKFDDWWLLYVMHDSTILISKNEHFSNRQFNVSDLIEIPESEKMFIRSGFSFKVRRNIEIPWLQNELAKRVSE